MSITRKTITEKVRTITVEWEGETLDVGIYPGRYTPELMSEVMGMVKDAEGSSEQAQLDTVGQMVQPLLAWWDLYDDEQAEQEGRRMPVNAATIATIPLSLTQAILVKASQSVRPPTRQG